MRINLDSPQKPNNVGLYFEEFLSIFLESLANIGRDNRENLWDPKFHS